MGEWRVGVERRANFLKIKKINCLTTTYPLTLNLIP